MGSAPAGAVSIGARVRAPGETMQAIVVREFGGPEVLRLEQVPRPEAGPGELLVEVHAAGVNPVDVSNHEDGEWAGIELPYTPGSDVSGVVRAVGDGVAGFSIGDEVFALTDFLGVRHGSYAEIQVVPAAIVASKPASLSHVEAASVPLAAGTAYELIAHRLDLQRDERVVIFGAAGGVGGFATQLATQRGAAVIAIGRAAAHPYLRSLGAALMLDHTTGDVFQQISDAVGEIDAIVDLVGGRTVEQSLPWSARAAASGPSRRSQATSSRRSIGTSRCMACSCGPTARGSRCSRACSRAARSARRCARSTRCRMPRSRTSRSCAVAFRGRRCSESARGRRRGELRPPARDQHCQEDVGGREEDREEEQRDRERSDRERAHCP